MLANGNGAPAVCAANLLHTVRGEVPMARAKGIGWEHFDTPESSRLQLAEDAVWVLETFEPRLETREVDVIAGMSGTDCELRVETD